MRHAPTFAACTLSVLLGAAALLPTAIPVAQAADLVVDGTQGSLTYSFTIGTASYDNIYVGQPTVGTINQSGGTLNVTTGQLFIGASVGSIGTYNLSGGTLNTISTDVGDSGTGTFTLSGSGVHNVTGTDGAANGSLDLAFYGGSNGTYNLNGGTLTAGYVRGGAGVSTFNFNGGTLTAGASATDFLQNLTHAYVGNGGVQINTNGFDVTVAQNLEHTNAGGATATDGGLTKNGAGTLTLSGASTYTGATAIRTGTLAITGSVNSPNATLTVDGSGGTATTAATLSLSGANGSLNVSNAYVGVANAGAVNQSGGSLTVQGGVFLGNGLFSGGTYNLSGGTLSAGTVNVGYSGIGTFNQTGGTHTTGTLALTGYNDESPPNTSGSVGTYNLDGGTLNVGQVTSGTGGANANSTFNFNGGTLQAQQSTATFLQGLTTANVRNGGVKIDTAGFNVTVAQPLVHSTVSADNNTDGGFIKTGAGTLTLTGANTYTGDTTVQGGTLLAANPVTGTSATGTGSVIVGIGTTLGGNGSVAGAVTVKTGATLAPGLAGPGRLTLGNALTLQAGSTLAVELGGTTAGSGYDRVLVTGRLTLGGSNLNVSVVNGFHLAIGQTFDLLVDSSTALVSGTFANTTTGALYTDSQGDTFLVNYTANADGGLVPNDVRLTVASVVPEPSTWALLGLGGAGLLVLTLRQRRRDNFTGLESFCEVEIRPMTILFPSSSFVGTLALATLAGSCITARANVAKDVLNNATALDSPSSYGNGVLPGRQTT